MEDWLSVLAEGRTEAAWDLFAERYRRLILATIGRLVPDRDDAMDVFSTVCQSLAADDCARLRRYSAQDPRGASVATWLVAVVRNLTVDWIRQRDGRRRPPGIPAQLSPLQREIYRAICLGGASHVEAYEMLRTRSSVSAADRALSFHQFLREVRATHRAAPCASAVTARDALRGPMPEEASAAPLPLDPAEMAELAQRLEGALASLPDDVRLAIDLFVVERMPAEDVARVVGWPNGKAVYNRVYRTLAALRAALEREGIGRGDLA